MTRPALSRVLAALGAIASATNVASADAVHDSWLAERS